jgi:hypothetical protein
MRLKICYYHSFAFLERCSFPFPFWFIKLGDNERFRNIFILYDDGPD